MSRDWVQSPCDHGRIRRHIHYLIINILWDKYSNHCGQNHLLETKLMLKHLSEQILQMKLHNQRLHWRANGNLSRSNDWTERVAFKRNFVWDSIISSVPLPPCLARVEGVYRTVWEKSVNFPNDLPNGVEFPPETDAASLNAIGSSHRDLFKLSAQTGADMERGGRAGERKYYLHLQTKLN